MTKLKARPVVDYTAMEGTMAESKNAVSPIDELTYVQKNAPEDDGGSCGWGPFKPGCCQRFRNPKWVLFWLCWAGAIQGMVVNGFVNVVISNIERRFEISSTQSGTIASCYDIASVLCLIPVSYFGGLGIKPRYLGIGIFILGVGSFVFSLPHFTTPLYTVQSSQENICRIGGNTTGTCDTVSAESLSDYKYVFFLGQLLHGAGASPLYTLGVTYLDENLPLRSSSFYVGIFYSFAIIGPAIGYMAGGEFLKIFTDTGAIDTSSLSITPDNPRWVGAWWIGFLFSGALAFFVSVPLFGFPRALPGSSKYMAERGKEVHNKGSTEDEANKIGNKRGIKDILLSIKLLVTNPTFMFLNFAAASEGILLSGFSTFAPKFIESQFSLPAASAAQFVGYAAIPAGGGGTFLGGYIVKRFNMKVSGIIRFCLGATLIVLFVALVFLINCENVPFAGVNVEYNASANNMAIGFLGKRLDNTCNSNCACTEDDYHPVCGRDGLMYFSPCYAGCQVSETGDVKSGIEERYSNCSCINSNTSDYMAEFGKCETSCIWLPLFMPFFAMMMLLTFVTSMPALSATLRCVPEKQRSFGLGIQWIIARCLGSIPGPILFGKMIDLTCLLWQKKCDGDGACFFYDNRKMSYYLLALGLSLKALSSLFFFLALVMYKKPPENIEEVGLNDNTSVSAISSTSRTTLNAQTNGTEINTVIRVPDSVANGTAKSNGNIVKTSL
ncbi:solute carrier organic anion transporter family member 4A1-like [Haliotis cracherodii]|uniref:solute carrier organic anion transporter family member 4A1-like n=1 Tax=Haliotis cracherodii TaxID=6455 RepID=UPI0039ECE0EB